MPNWLIASIVATILFGIYPILGDRAGQIHGPRMNLVLDSIIFFLLSALSLFFYRHEVSLITKKSLIFGLLMGLFSSFAFILMLYAWQWAPAKLPKIMVVIGFSTIITAVISNFTGAKLTITEWFWVAGATVCITGLNWKS